MMTSGHEIQSTDYTRHSLYERLKLSRELHAVFGRTAMLSKQCYSAPDRAAQPQSIVMCVSVCLSVCVCVCVFV